MLGRDERGGMESVREREYRRVWLRFSNFVPMVENEVMLLFKLPFCINEVCDRLNDIYRMILHLEV